MVLVLFSDLQKLFTYLIYVDSALGLQRSDINAYPSLFLDFAQSFQLSKPVSAPSIWMRQRSVDLKQHISPHICNMYADAQLYNNFTIRGDASLINP